MRNAVFNWGEWFSGRANGAFGGLVWLILCLSQPAMAADKSSYHWFNPTPRDEMRELSTDRPDQTESPYTVDAGHIQIEADIVKHTYNREKFHGENKVSRQWDLANTNVKLGLTNSTELQLITANFVDLTESDKSAGARRQAEGFGDTLVRVKHNFWGNDSGEDAFSLMPYLKVPTNVNNTSSDDLEGGLIVLYALDLGQDYSLGLMPQFDMLKDRDGGGYHPSFLHTAALSRDWGAGFSTYYEFFVQKGTDSKDLWNVMFDTGATYLLTPDVQLDAGVNIGLTKAANDYQPFIGITVRY